MKLETKRGGGGEVVTKDLTVINAQFSFHNTNMSE
jgi:hypothetical protein